MRVHIGDTLDNLAMIDVYIFEEDDRGSTFYYLNENGEWAGTFVAENQRAGRPSFSIPRRIADAFFDAVVQYKLQKGSDPQTEVKVLRENLAHERERVDRFISALLPELLIATTGDRP